MFEAISLLEKAKNHSLDEIQNGLIPVLGNFNKNLLCQKPFNNSNLSVFSEWEGPLIVPLVDLRLSPKDQKTFIIRETRRLI